MHCRVLLRNRLFCLGGHKVPRWGVLCYGLGRGVLDQTDRAKGREWMCMCRAAVLFCGRQACPGYRRRILFLQVTDHPLAPQISMSIVCGRPRTEKKNSFRSPISPTLTGSQIFGRKMKSFGDTGNCEIKACQPKVGIAFPRAPEFQC